MNTRGEDKCKFLFHKYSSIFKNLENNVRTFVANKYLRIKN